MEASLRRTMTSVTDTLFPVSKAQKKQQQHQILKAETDCLFSTTLSAALYILQASDCLVSNYVWYPALNNIGNDYISNLPLQMAIYFNAFYAPFWITMTLVGLEAKYQFLPILYKIVLIAVYVAYMIIEVVRLYLGYLGNLMERVPELAGSWLLTILIQLPLMLLLLFNEGTYILPFERAANIVEGMFILFEIVSGYFAIRVMVNYQVTKFHIRQFTDLEQMPDGEYWLDEGEEVHEHYA